MNNAAIIGFKKAQKNISGSISEIKWPEAPKSTSKRNDNPVSRHFALLAKGKRSPTAAIHAMCAHCMGCSSKEQGYGEEDWMETGFRKQICNCSAPKCPLWEFRPFQGGAA